MKLLRHANEKFRYIETIVMIIIAGCMIFLNIFTTQKLSALEHSKKDAMFVMDEIVFNNDEDFTKEIVEYLPEPYKLIEVYNDKLELQFHVEFNDHHDAKKDSLSNYPNLISILKSHEEGQTTTKIGDSEQDIYFKWLNSSGGKHLLMVYSSAEEVKGLWLFTLICYIVIVLVFLLLISSKIRSYHEKVKEYNELTNINKS